MYNEWEIVIPGLMNDEPRRAFIYVPDEACEGAAGLKRHQGDSHDQGQKRYPVLYMFDGQNLYFDEEASYGKSWGLMKYLEQNRVPLILASIECNHLPEDDPAGGRLSE